MNKKMLSLFSIALFLVMTPVWSADSDVDTIKKTLSRLVPGQPVDSIVKTPVAGMYEVTYGADVFYIDDSGRYLLRGDLIDIQRLENITETKRAKGRRDMIANVPVSSMLIYKAKDERHVVTVFTDIDCNFCRRMHSEMAEYNSQGITMRYLAFPRSGLNSPSYYKAVSVWCAKDREQAMTRSKAGEKLARVECDNPVEQHLALASQFAVSGTPTMILPSGEVVPGYVPALQLATMLDGQVKR